MQSANRKYHLGRTLPKENSNGIHINYLTRDPTMALNYLTQILKHGNRIMCFGPSGMEHVSILSQNKHSFFLNLHLVSITKQNFMMNRGKNILLNIIHQTIRSI